MWTDLSKSVNPSADSCSLLVVNMPPPSPVQDYWVGGASYITTGDALFQVFDPLLNRGGAGWRLSYSGAANSFQTLVPELGG